MLASLVFSKKAKPLHSNPNQVNFKKNPSQAKPDKGTGPSLP
jgi:hypothetical protein